MSIRLLVRRATPTYVWSGRGDLNARLPVPKAVFGIAWELPVFKCFGFKGMAGACCSLWSAEESGGSRQLHFLLHSGKMRMRRTNAMALDHSDERRHAHAFLDRLPDDQLSAVCGLLETMLSPLDRKLALAPIDDEPVTPDDAAAILAGITSLEQNGGVPLGELLADFGLTTDDFHKMAEDSAPEDAA